VTLTSTTTAQEFFIMLPVGALANGFTMEVLDGTEVICTKQLETNLAQIVRNEVKRFNPLLIGETPIPIDLPDVVTNEVTGITTTTATAGGEIISDGGSAITECGVCWSTEGEPTVDGDHMATQVTMGEFSVILAGLTQNTTYYIRAYAINEAGTGYGDVITFTTEEEIVITVPTVTTAEVTEITTTTATVGGEITDAGNGTISESGICYKTGNAEWTCVALEVTENAFSTTLTDLAPNTTYTVRAYATNEEGTGYGEEVSFITLEEVPTLPEGAINGKFTINANGDQVYFSQGNLQYQASTDTWRFAENQWDYVGNAYEGTVYESGTKCNNALVSPNYVGWIDNFCWGTSGYNHGAVCYQPWSTSMNNNDYWAYGSSTSDLNSQTPATADWGYNAISNGGNAENSGWRTLTQPEWQFLLSSRSTESGIHYAKSRIEISSGNYVNGLIMLPDDWNSSNYALNNTDLQNVDYTSNTISVEDWTNVFEANGAVYLPAGGWRHGTTVNMGTNGGMYKEGIYWTTTHYSSYTAYDIIINPTYFLIHNPDAAGRYAGLNVRLAVNVE